MSITNYSHPLDFPRKDSDLFTPRNSIEEINLFLKNWLLHKGGGGIMVWHYQATHKMLDLYVSGKGIQMDKNLHITCSDCTYYSGKLRWGTVSLNIYTEFDDYGLIIIKNEKANVLIKCRGITLSEDIPFRNYGTLGRYSANSLYFQSKKSELHTNRDTVEQISEFIQSWLAQGGTIYAEVWGFNITHTQIRVRLYTHRQSIEESLFVNCACCDSFAGNTSWTNPKLEISVAYEEDDFGCHKKFIVSDKASEFSIKCAGISVVILNLDSIR